MDSLRPDQAPATRPLAVRHAGPAGLFEWMQERESIRQAKQRGDEPPWTTDPILKSHYFTNVMREYDKVSVWIYDNIITHYKYDSTLPLMLAVCRWINRPQTLEHMMEHTDWIHWGTHAELTALARSLDNYKGRMFGGAYVISANGMRWGSWNSKHHYVLREVCGELVGWDPPLGSMQEFTEALDYKPNWGGFMSYEVACDLRWAEGWLMGAPDIYTWANPGPGAVRGLMDVFTLSQRPNKKASVSLMRSLLEKAEEFDWKIDMWPRPFEMRDIEHSLCEYNKYMKISKGGKAKRGYPLKKKG